MRLCNGKNLVVRLWDGHDLHTANGEFGLKRTAIGYRLLICLLRRAHPYNRAKDFRL